MSSNQDPRGSLWHRWDPHLHAPGTLLNDQFGGDWTAYLARIEKSEPRIEALGVTDYFCIGTYKEVRKRKAAGALPDIKFLFPNVELRLETKTASARPINIHLLFSADDPNHEDQIERVLGQLTFDTDHRIYACTESGLIDLGRAHDSKQTDKRGALKTGANQFKTSLRDLRNLFKTDRWLRENCVVAIPCRSGDGTSGLQNDDAFAMMRTELESFADIIFSSRPKDRSYWLGETPGMGRDAIERRYRSLKPCLHGSDAHCEEQTGAPDIERYCWLKGDLDFETLRQVVVEPGERTWISTHPPSGPIPALTIKRVSFESARWMKQNKVELNSGLIAIIGARGSGKTALADIIATGAHAVDAGQGDASFLKRASNPKDLLGNAAVAILWGDGSETSRLMRPGPASEQFDMVRYLSQHFVEKLCSSAGLAIELRAAMERVVFESTNPLDRLEAKNFEELADRSLVPIRTTNANLQMQIDEIGDTIVQEEILRDGLSRAQRERDGLAKKIESARIEQQKLIPKGNETRIRLLATLESACLNGQSVVESLRLRIKTIDDLSLAATHVSGTAEATRFASMRQRFAGANLTDQEWNVFGMHFAGDTSVVITAAKKRAEEAVALALSGDPAAKIDALTTPPALWPLNLLSTERDKLKTAVGIDQDRKRKYDEAQKIIGNDELAVKRLNVHIQHAQGADARRAAHVALRRRVYLDIFEQLVKEEQVLNDLYAPLKTRLIGAKGALSKLAFVTERTLDIDGWCETGEKQFDLRSGDRVRGRGGIKKFAEQYLVHAWKTGNAEQVAAAMDQFRAEIQKEMANMPPWINHDLRRAWYKAISAWLYNTDHIRLRYGIEYDGVAIEQLSPGTRGVVLLLLYMGVDLHDQRPIIIDQPEENLDPNSVFEELVPYFREARGRRQVIIVTHNANLVVNTDADQVIVATANRIVGAALPQIDYQSGSLENPRIRETVCKILEGGERAFLERERRYRLRWGQDLVF